MDAQPVHGEWAPETSPTQIADADLFPPERLRPTPSEVLRPKVITFADKWMDMSHPEFRAEPWPTTRSGLLAALDERAALVAECATDWDMRMDATMPYRVDVRPGSFMEDVRTLRVDQARFDAMASAEGWDAEAAERTAQFAACVRYALSSATFAIRDPDEDLEFEVELARPRSSAEHAQLERAKQEVQREDLKRRGWVLPVPP